MMDRLLKIALEQATKTQKLYSFFILDARWGWVVNTMPRPLYPRQRPGKGKGKGKAVPLQAWSGPEGSRQLRFPDFMTTAQAGGKVVGLTHRPPLPPGNIPGTDFC
jgi:hypothetical protein